LEKIVTGESLCFHKANAGQQQLMQKKTGLCILFGIIGVDSILQI